MRATVAFLMAILAWISADAIVVRHDREEQRYLNLASDFPATVTVRRADGRNGLGDEGTLIDARWVLTAAHVAADLGPGDLAEVRGTIHHIARVVRHPDWHSEADVKADVALLQLVEPVTDITPARLYTGTDEQGLIATFVGRGGTGTGLTGPVREDRRLRAATNRVERAQGSTLRFRFDEPADADATDLEGISGPGDSGGPAYIQRDGATYVIGVSSGQDSRPAGRQRGHYKVLEYYARVSSFATWIRGVLANP
jgi:hypothetical protein